MLEALDFRLMSLCALSASHHKVKGREKLVFSEEIEMGDTSSNATNVIRVKVRSCLSGISCRR